MNNEAAKTARTFDDLILGIETFLHVNNVNWDYLDEREQGAHDLARQIRITNAKDETVYVYGYFQQKIEHLTGAPYTRICLLAEPSDMESWGLLSPLCVEGKEVFGSNAPDRPSFDDFIQRFNKYMEDFLNIENMAVLAMPERSVAHHPQTRQLQPQLRC